MGMSSLFSKRKLQWWLGEADWLAPRVERWMTFCHGYSKLRDRPPSPGQLLGHTPGQPPGQPPGQRVKSRLKTCAARLQCSLRGTSRGSNPPPAQKPEPGARHQDWTRFRQPASKTAPAPPQAPANDSKKPRSTARPPAPTVPAPAPTDIVFEKCKPRPLRDQDKANREAVGPEIVYYPFREEDCVVCRRMGISRRATCCTLDDCEFATLPACGVSERQREGVTGALFFREMVEPPAPSRALVTQDPVISMNQDFIEVRYVNRDDRGPPVRPPPTYRRAAAVQDRERVGRAVFGDLSLFSPPVCRAARDFSTPQVRYRSRGKFSSVMYETQRAFEDAFRADGEVMSWPRVRTRVEPLSEVRSRSLNGPPAPRELLREVDLPANSAVRGLLSFRRRPGRPQKRVVVGERGLRGPVWPRVILTFDRGVSPCSGSPSGVAKAVPCK